jgi:uncharacterized protein (TIGR03790 family)
LTIFCIFLLAREGSALGPHEVLVLANGNSPRSLDLAKTYISLRQIPAINLIELNLPPNATDMTPEAFTRQILTPALAAAKNRGLSGHILAWAYSLDFPIRITTDPPVSIQGFTFLRGHIPDRTAIQNGSYASPLFAGPDNPKFQGFPSQSLDVQKAWMGPDMPLPSMMLGYAGPRGNTMQEILAALERGRKADGTHPDGTLYFVTNTDIRSTCRQWEFAPAVTELRTAGISACITNAIPLNQTNVIGLLCGMAEVDLSRGIGFTPGAMADHLTSFGASFDIAAQTKVSAWIRAGATATAGAITEPFSIWTKFPHARYFFHLASGGTTIEAFFQAVRCPFQTLFLGDPLSAPWSPSSTLSLVGIKPGILARGRHPITVALQSPPGESFGQFLFLLDGIPLEPRSRRPAITLNSTTLPAGPHQFRAVAYQTGSTRPQVFTEIEFSLTNNLTRQDNALN